MATDSFHQFKLRMPRELFDRLEDVASAQNRSVSAEIIHRLELTFEAEATTISALDADIQERLASIEAAIERLRGSGPIAVKAAAGSGKTKELLAATKKKR